MKKRILNLVLLSLVVVAWSGCSGEKMMMYTIDGEVRQVSEKEKRMYEDNGWYEYPVVKLYNAEGENKIVRKSETGEWEEDGWYQNPVIKIYSPDGKTKVVSKNDIEQWKNEGWYEYPVVKLYTNEGEEVVIPKEQAPTLIKKGWSYEKKVVKKKEEVKNEKKQNTYFTYQNSRYGYRIDVPEFLNNKRYADNGDGGIFYNDDESVSLSVYGHHHLPELYSPMVTNVKQLFEHEKRTRDYVINYDVQKDNWFVISGNRGDEVVYERYFFKSDDTVNVFSIVYPRSREKEFDEIVTHISKSFKTGIGGDSVVQK